MFLYQSCLWVATGFNGCLHEGVLFFDWSNTMLHLILERPSVKEETRRTRLTWSRHCLVVRFCCPKYRELSVLCSRDTSTTRTPHGHRKMPDTKCGFGVVGQNEALLIGERMLIFIVD